MPKLSFLEFSGNTPPDLFVGRFNYPNVFAGVLTSLNNKNICSDPEEWYQQKLSIKDILKIRSSLVYARTKIGIKNTKSRITDSLKELAMSSESCSAEFKLEKQPKNLLNFNIYSKPIGNPAPLKSIRLESNPKVKKIVDYVVDNSDMKASDAVSKLYNKINISSINKLLSAGLLGIKRKLVPTRWAITATDDMISNQLLKSIKKYSLINQFILFSNKYLGNIYNIILIPDFWGFEVIELEKSDQSYIIWQDYEGFFPRKNYASKVTGAYYANRLAVCEYLSKIKKQASIIVLREVTKDYEVPLGVGILREATKDAFNKKPLMFNTKKELIDHLIKTLGFKFDYFKQRSTILNKKEHQISLNNYL